jgi:thiamine transport system permease protein
LGAGPLRRLRTIVGPVVRPALALAAGLAFAVSLGEFGATAFLARDDSPTLPQLIFRLLGRPGDAAVGQAMALGVLMVVLTGGVFAAVESVGGGRAIEF